MTDVIDLMARPVFGMAQVDGVLRLRPGTARRWIDGYTRGGKDYLPVVRPSATGEDLVTWGEFVEARLLSEFRSAGVPLLRLRPAVERLRDEMGVLYPLAYARPWLDADGKELVRRIQREIDLDHELRFVVVRNDQLLLTAPAGRFVASSVFDETSRVVERIRPDAEFADVFVDPVRHFGAPVVRSVPTEVIAEQYVAGDQPEMIAGLYELSPDLVHQAIRFELKRSETLRAA